MSRKRKSIRQSLLQGINSSGTNSQGGLTDEDNATNLAKRMFEYYNKDHSEFIDNYEISSMIKDVYSAIGVQFEPTEEDINQYIKTIDHDGDGQINMEDLEAMLNKYLV